MERKEIKRVLKEMGVREEFLEMPAVIEPIYVEMMEKTASDLSGKGRISVDENGDFSFGDRKIKLNKEGCAEITQGDYIITTNTVGIEVAYSDGNWQDFFSHISRDNGIVVNSSGNNGNASYYESTHLDKGSWSIRNASGINIGVVASHNRDKEFNPFPSTPEEVLSEFDEVSGSIIENYPNTAEWYAKTREALKVVAEKEADPEKQNKDRIEFLERKVARLEREKRDLIQRNSKLTSMLEKTLEFMDTVRKSPVGKIFFGKSLKKYEDETKRLPEGREDM